MPLFDTACRSCGAVFERFYRHYDDPPQPCLSCGGADTLKLMGAPNIVFSGTITARYNDKSKEGAHQEGHWAWEEDPTTGRNTKPVFISDFQQQREFCKRNGLFNPKDAPTNWEIDPVTRTEKNTRGLPGTEL